MLEFIMLIVMPIILVLALAGLSFAVGALAALSATSSGPDGVVIWGMVAVLVAGLFGLGFGRLLGEMHDFRTGRYKRVGGYVFAAVCAVCASWLPVDTVMHGHERAAYMRQMAPLVQAFATDRFADIDTDHNGLITTQKMNYAAAHISMSPAEIRAFNHLSAHFSEVGHAIGSYRSGKSTYYIYGVSQQDALTYPARVNTYWQKW